MLKYKIGFLPYEKTINFSNGKIDPLKDFAETDSLVKSEANRDGFYYPPVMHTVKEQRDVVDGKLITKKEVVPNSSRPAQLFYMPSTHEIEITSPSCVVDPRKGDALFLTYLLAFHFGVRLQFDDWLVDGKVPIKINQDFHATHIATENFIDQAYLTWKNANDDGKLRLTNLLYMQSRVCLYEWDWEKFIICYMVFDGCYKYLNNNFGIRSNHRGRFQVITDHYDMQYDQVWIDRIVDLRNNLFHETLWDSGQPCNSGSNQSFATMFHLSKLNTRIITAILGYDEAYAKSPWWSRSRFSF